MRYVTKVGSAQETVSEAEEDDDDVVDCEEEAHSPRASANCSKGSSATLFADAVSSVAARALEGDDANRAMVAVDVMMRFCIACRRESIGG